MCLDNRQWPIHRADLQQTLVDASRARGVTLRLGCPVINIERGCCGVAAVVKGGERIDADFVVAADGQPTLRELEWRLRLPSL